MIIDWHVHLFPTREVGAMVLDGMKEQYGVGYHSYGTPDEFCADMQRAGIDYGVIQSFAPDRQLKNNNFWTVAFTSAGKNRPSNYPMLIPFCSVSPSMKGRTPVEELDKRLAWGMRGVKIHPPAQNFAPDDPRMWPVYAWLVEHDMLITAHAGINITEDENTGLGHPDRWRPVLKDFPSLRLVLAHMGGGFWEETMRLCRDFPTVLLDTAISISPLSADDSTCLDAAQAVEMIRSVGVERVMFGTDYPWIDPQANVECIRALNLNRDEMVAVLGGNASRELGLG